MLVLQEATMHGKLWYARFCKQDYGGPPCMQMPEIIIAAMMSVKGLESHPNATKFH